MSFGAFIAWLPFRQAQRELELLAWGLANCAFYVAVGATVVVSVLMPGATRYVAGGVAVLLLAKLVASRRLVRSGG
jgi:hypothetical protein